MRELYDFQREGVRFLADGDRYLYLADEMGLGKTVQAIRAADEIGVLSTLVVCPASVVENWTREWHDWYGPGRLRVVSYSKLIRMDLDRLPQVDLVILDEAHYCKSVSAQRTQAALKVASRAPRAWLLSGTPFPNNAVEIYAPMKALWPDLLPVTTKFRFMDRYCKWTQSDYGYQIWGLTELGRTELPNLVKQFMLRRKVSDVALDLPPLRLVVQTLPHDPGVAEKIAELADDTDNPDVMATNRRLLGSYKAPAIAKILAEELKDGAYKQIVVLYHHRDTGSVIHRALVPSGAVVGFDGSTPQPNRQAAIDRFQSGGASVFLAQQTAAGIGITLTAANEIVLVEPSWSPEDNAQAIKRIHRIGQDQPCRARIFAQPGTLDESLMHTLRRKSEMIHQLLEE